MNVPLQQVHRAVRNRICRTCPRKSQVPGECERGCTLFESLDRLTRVLAMRDPMLRSPAQTLEDELRQQPRGTVPKAFHHELSLIFRRLIDHRGI